jgi:hypothetical protein
MSITVNKGRVKTFFLRVRNLGMPGFLLSVLICKPIQAALPIQLPASNNELTTQLN